MSAAWYIVILVGILAYVLLDGYDLGAGIITLVTRDRGERDEIVEGIGSIWDGNETWLVFVGVALFAGLPGAFGLILPHLYVPLILMLFGLILRGVSVEMISQPHTHKGGAEGWYRTFGVGSLLAAFMQGLALGTLSVNVAHDGVRYLGGSFAFVGWFPLLMAVTVTFGYVALGYAWMHLHRIGRQDSVTARGRWASLIAVVGAVVALATVGLTDSGYRFFSPAIGWAFSGLRAPGSGQVEWMVAADDGSASGGEGEGIVPRPGAATWIGQDTLIIDAPLRDNLRLGAPHATDDRLVEALRAVGLESTVKRLADGLGTLCGSAGWRFSTGELRRIAIARALLRGSSVWLLDEPTEHLDPDTEQEVLDALKKACMGRTVVIATHSPVVIDQADQVFAIGLDHVLRRAQIGTDSESSQRSSNAPSHSTAPSSVKEIDPS